jgi:hypothetical protein
MDTQRLMPNIEHRQLTNCLRISRERPVVQTSVKFKAASIPSSLFINLEIFFQRFFLHHQKFNFVKFYKELVTNKILTPCIILSNILSNICLTLHHLTTTWILSPELPLSERSPSSVVDDLGDVDFGSLLHGVENIVERHTLSISRAEYGSW